MMPLRVRLLTLLVALAVLSCGDTHILTGTFRSQSPVTLPDIEGFTDISVELVIGHYGPDVAGLMKYFGNSDFNIAPSASDFCQCKVLQSGVYSGDEETLTFAFVVPSPCATAKEQVSVSLVMSKGGEQLDGTMRFEDRDPVTVVFVRHKHEAEMVPEDRECEAE